MLPPMPAVSTAPPNASVEAAGKATDANMRATGMPPFALILAVADDAASAANPTLAAPPASEDADAAAGGEAVPLASPFLFAAYAARDAAMDAGADPTRRADPADPRAVAAAANALPAAALPVDEGARANPATNPAVDAGTARAARGPRDDRNAPSSTALFAAADVVPAAPGAVPSRTELPNATGMTPDVARSTARRAEPARGAAIPPAAGVAARATPITPALADGSFTVAPEAGATGAAPAPSTATPGTPLDAAGMRADARNGGAPATPSAVAHASATPAPAAAMPSPQSAPVAEIAAAPGDPPATPAAATLAAATPAPAPAAAPVVATPVGAPGWTQDVAQHLAHVVTLRNGHAELQLSPAHLGAIEVRITFTAGEPAIAITAADPGTRAALEQSLPQLRELLANQGITLGQAFVQGEAPRQSAYAQPPQRTPEADAPGVVATGPEPGAAARLRTGDRLVDTFA